MPDPVRPPHPKGHRRALGLSQVGASPDANPVRIPFRGEGIVRSSRANSPGAHGFQRPRNLDRRRRRLRRYQSELRIGPKGVRGFLESIPSRLHHEPTAGMVLLFGAVLALLWANSPWRATYHAISEYTIGPASLHLNLPIAHWASDGLLAIFFFVVGLELKTEFVTGALRDLRQAMVPVLAAVFGMVGPAVVYVAIQLATDSDGLHGWAIPVATDIAFAVALLGIFGRGLPPAVRTFLLTLAVVDDLLGIIIIATFYTESLNFLALLGAFAVIAVFAVLVNRRITSPLLLIPLALLAWALMHISGVHSTIAGVLLGLMVPATIKRGEHEALTNRWAERFHPYSAGLVLPVFAFFAAGVTLIEGSGTLTDIFLDPVALGVILALPFGKLIGIWGGTALLVKNTPLRLGGGVDLPDLVGVALLGGIGFTVSLLIAGLSFGESPHTDHAKIGVIVGSLLAAILGALALKRRVRTAVRRG
ncbi:Na+:H+ antiporter, NhaA family [Bowdeniella nasicola]|uniref:Na(+)/H(+) antiporter NhaA n=1 Tax=Bowdeniella nasicola TaxID=208480 RepID=A0A1H4A6J4_9ACTO|nr:Na+/H+ antiporter NhaA [Bowdeniella nasicola]SEA31510.1 Na+:H+ antiporter, NhaA family [Bowdeniella nasicola]